MVDPEGAAPVIVREHKRSEDGEFCRFCGANYIGGTFGTEATCLAREETHESYEIRPEPARRQYAFDDIDTINRRIAEIRAEQPMCPQNSGRTLYACLRSDTKCGESCEFHADWIGPE